MRAQLGAVDTAPRSSNALMTASDGTRFLERWNAASKMAVLNLAARSPSLRRDFSQAARSRLTRCGNGSTLPSSDNLGCHGRKLK